MLYDKRWDKEVKAGPFSLESLIAWLEKQPGQTEYNYCNPMECLIAQYLMAHGFSDGAEVLEAEALDRLGWEDIAHDCEGFPQRWTFGAALERARAALDRG